MVISLLIPVILLGLLVFVGMFVVSKRTGSEERGEATMKTIYIYVVLFATLMLTIGGGIGVFMALSDLVSPPAGYYQTYDQYKLEQTQRKEAGGVSTPAPSEQELRTTYDRIVQDEKERTKQRALNSLIKSLGFIAIPFPIFLYYQRRLKD